MSVVNTLDPEFISKVNGHFLIRVFDVSGKSSLKGFGQLHKFLGIGGVELSKQIADEAFEHTSKGNKRGPEYRYTKKLRRGVRIDFYVK